MTPTNTRPTPTRQPTRTLIPSPALPHVGRTPPQPRFTWADLLEAVREAGRYPTTAEAEHITRVVIAALGSQITGDERVALAHALPRSAAALIASEPPARHPSPAAEFVESLIPHLEGATPATARWHAGSVLSTLPPLLGTPLTTRLLSQLPPGYALLFGKAQLTPHP
ncbi:DUF2267 domain-containing protein [Streptomyces sp. BK239]|uniref:DUF2267 domain-containing protein n=1 Tax=Streptomyces sp. BK239 TaxID=2512155 RepID=UPI0032424D68